MQPGKNDAFGKASLVVSSSKRRNTRRGWSSPIISPFTLCRLRIFRHGQRTFTVCVDGMGVQGLKPDVFANPYCRGLKPRPTDLRAREVVKRARLRVLEQAGLVSGGPDKGGYLALDTRAFLQY
jgi:hypothetical protein